MNILFRLLTSSLYILPFFLPSYMISLPLSWGGSLNLLDLFQVIILALFGLHLSGSCFRANWDDFTRKHRLRFIPIGLLLIGLFFSFYFQFRAIDTFSSLGLIKSYFVLPLGVALVVVYLVHNNLLNLNKFLFSYYLYASVLSLGGVFYLVTQRITFDHRLSFLFNSPNFLAMSLAPGMLIGAGYFLKRILLPDSFFLKILLRREVLALLWLSQAACLLATQSLGAVIGLLGAGLVISFPFRSRKILILSVFLSVFSWWIIFILPWLLSRASYAPSIPAASLDSRLAIYQSALKIGMDNWLWGIGPGNFQAVYLDYQKYFSPYPQWAVPHSHNLLLHIWVELGLLPLVGLLSLLIMSFQTKKQTPEKLITCAMMVGIEDGNILPNDWEAGKLNLTDTFWKINTQNGKKERLIELSEMTQSFDAENLLVDPEERYLFFVDRKIGEVYRIEL